MSAYMAVAAGCQQPDAPVRPKTPPEPVARVDQVHLWAPLQPTVKVGGGSGADAFVVEVFFEQAGQNMPVTVSGSLDMLLFAGRVEGEGLSQAKPLQTWSFSPPQLSGMLIRGQYGMFGYRLMLPWDKPPARPMVTLVAKYRPPQGPPVISSPISVAIAPM